MKNEKIDLNNVARISEGEGGFYITPESATYLDHRGYGYRTKKQAQDAALEQGYTHMIGSGARGKGGSAKIQKINKAR